MDGGLGHYVGDCTTLLNCWHSECQSYLMLKMMLKAFRMFSKNGKMPPVHLSPRIDCLFIPVIVPHSLHMWSLFYCIRPGVRSACPNLNSWCPRGYTAPPPLLAPPSPTSGIFLYFTLGALSNLFFLGFSVRWCQDISDPSPHPSPCSTATMPIYHIGKSFYSITRSLTPPYQTVPTDKPLVHVDNNLMANIRSVLFKLKPGVTPTQITEFVTAAKSMVGKIPGLLKLESNTPHPSTAHRGQGFNMGLVATLEKADDIKVYADHPAHLEYVSVSHTKRGTKYTSHTHQSNPPFVLTGVNVWPQPAL